MQPFNPSASTRAPERLPSEGPTDPFPLWTRPRVVVTAFLALASVLTLGTSFQIEALRNQIFEILGLSLAGLLSGKVWQPFTFMLLHYGALHLLSQLVFVYWLVGAMEREITQQGMLLFVLLVVTLGTISSLLFAVLVPYQYPFFGASPLKAAGLAFYTLRPRRYFIFFRVLDLRYVCAFLLLLSLVALGAGTIGGSLAGAIFAALCFRSRLAGPLRMAGTAHNTV